MKYLLVLSASLLLVGCNERYRYACQDPANWGSEECTKPLCEVSQTCPDFIFKDMPNIKTTSTGSYTQQQLNKGGCK